MDQIYYVRYLIIVDSFCAIITLAGLLYVVLFFRFVIKKWNYKGADFAGMVFVEFLICLVLFMCLFENISNLAKDVYIPEVRIYQELQAVIKK